MATKAESPAQFTPLRTASRFERVLVVIFGPLLWVAALVVAALVFYGRDAIEIGVIVTLGAFVLWLPFCWLGRRRRLHDQKVAEAL